MCGIAGIVTPGVKRRAKELRAMTDALHHRGPDSKGTHLFENCGLGHRRLSVVDLRTGHQPMLSSQDACGITFNGEIYGYQDIRTTCRGYQFKTTSDTEVILALYAQFGKQFIERLPGMFAFAVWDDIEQEIICARDRFGEKPFYFAFGAEGEFIFASEIKALIASGLIRPVLDKEAVSFYLQYRYVNPRQTIYRNIFTLPPAHILFYRSGNLVVKRYWDLPQKRSTIGLSQAQEDFKRLLDAAVSKQLMADVPVGIFLSGGLDSSTIVAYASRKQPDIQTFSYGFEEFVNELPFARDVAGLYKTRQVELFDANLNLPELMLTLQEVYDEPFADSSSIPTFLMSKLAREHVKVVLSGDGGDELLGGYTDWYRPLCRMERLDSRMMLFYRILVRTISYMKKFHIRISTSIQEMDRAISLFRKYGAISDAHRINTRYFSEDELNCLGLPRPSTEVSNWRRHGSNTLDGVLRMDIENFLAGDILVKTDRASMAHGLELRAPFLDVEFASFCISLPSRLKVTGDSDKFILRKACSALWPDSVRQRGKMGFGGPVHKWMRRESVRKLGHEYLGYRQRKIFDLLDYRQCRRLAAKSEVQAWILLMLSLWVEHHHFNLS